MVFKVQYSYVPGGPVSVRVWTPDPGMRYGYRIHSVMIGFRNMHDARTWARGEGFEG
jgi:hypothetical protein